MDYFMAFVVGLALNLAIFKIQIHRLQQQIDRNKRFGTQSDLNINWRMVIIDAMFWGLFVLIMFYAIKKMAGS